MAGGGGNSNNDNPLPLNVVPLIDIIFCLLLFFMCSFHFKNLEGKMEAWLPQDKGNKPRNGPPPPPAADFRVALSWDANLQKTVRKFARTEYASDAELGEVLKQQFARYQQSGSSEVTPLTIASDSAVPWSDVARVMDIACAQSLPKLEFALAGRAFEMEEPR